MIIDGRGRLVWFHQLTPPNVATNLRPQRFGGHKVLTWWQGGSRRPRSGIGEGVIADRPIGRSRRPAPATATRPTCTSSC